MQTRNTQVYMNWIANALQEVTRAAYTGQDIARDRAKRLVEEMAAIHTEVDEFSVVGRRAQSAIHLINDFTDRSDPYRD